tara:strand:+ start:41574 stop:42059 length:486 start_codon:yes stop_codon:yes gene_type:complete
MIFRKRSYNCFLVLLPVLFLALEVAGQTTTENQEEAAEMEKVSGIGGIFFRSGNPENLALWYETHLGVSRTPQSYDEEAWQQEAGSTIFAPFQSDTDYFGNPAQAWMINFRVNDLDAMVRQLVNAGIDVVVDETEYPNGRFARLHDPEGNPIELWEPKLAD